MTALTHQRAHRWVNQTVGSRAKHLFNNNKLLNRLQSLIHVGTCPGIKIAPSGPPVTATLSAVLEHSMSQICHSLGRNISYFNAQLQHLDFYQAIFLHLIYMDC